MSHIWVFSGAAATAETGEFSQLQKNVRVVAAANVVTLVTQVLHYYKLKETLKSSNMSEHSDGRRRRATKLIEKQGRF